MPRARRHPQPAGQRGDPPSADAVLAIVERSIQAAWEHERTQHPDEDEAATARRIVDEPGEHPWRLVDAALLRLRCEACGTALGSGAMGCAACDLAHGFRFAAREPDRPGVPPGNEHAIRVSAAVLRAPHRHPAWAVESNRVHLPLFLAGDMPTRRQQEVMLTARDRGVTVEAAGARSFAELAARAASAGTAIEAPGLRRLPRERAGVRAEDQA